METPLEGLLTSTTASVAVWSVAIRIRSAPTLSSEGGPGMKGLLRWLESVVVTSPRHSEKIFQSLSLFLLPGGFGEFFVKFLTEEFFV